MSRVLRHTLVLVSTLLPLSLIAAHAQSAYFPNNTTINYTVNGGAIVGYGNSTDYNNKRHGTSPTVSVVTGANLNSYLLVENSSMVNFSGGSISNFLEGDNSSTVNVSGGSLDSVETADSSTINVSGGNISGSLLTYNNSTINVSGGSISGYLLAQNSSTINVSGGSISGYLEALNSTMVTVFGGTFGQYNGINFFDHTTGSFTVVGTNLQAGAGSPDAYFGGLDYNLSGTLQDGTNLTGYVLNVGDGYTFTLQAVPAAVPEPGSVALLTGLVMTGSTLLRRRRR